MRHFDSLKEYLKLHDTVDSVVAVQEIVVFCYSIPSALVNACLRTVNRTKHKTNVKKHEKKEKKNAEISFPLTANTSVNLFIIYTAWPITSRHHPYHDIPPDLDTDKWIRFVIDSGGAIKKQNILIR